MERRGLILVAMAICTAKAEDEDTKPLKSVFNAKIPRMTYADGKYSINV